MLQDIAIGAISKGVNHATFLTLNAVVACLWLLLASLLVHACFTEDLKHLAPHLAVMLGLCTCLGLVLNWVIANVGLRDVAAQEQEVMGDSFSKCCESLDSGNHGVSQDESLDEETARKLKELPLTSKLDLGLQEIGSFDTSGLAIQPISGTGLVFEKDKGL
jgi:hypothetical protein